MDAAIVGLGVFAIIVLAVIGVFRRRIHRGAMGIDCRALRHDGGWP